MTNEGHIATIKPSRIKYLSSYLAAFIIFSGSIYLNKLFNFNRNIFLLVYLACFILLAAPEILRHRNYHKITERNIIIIKNFGQTKRSILHSFNLDIHIDQNPVLKHFLDIGTLKIESFSGHGITMPHIKNPREVAKLIENLMVKTKDDRFKQ